MKKLLLIVFLFLISKYGFAQWTTSGTNIYNSNSGFVGIGTTSPGEPLDVTGVNGTLTGTAKINTIFAQDHTTYRGVLVGFDSSGQTGVIAASSIGAGSNLAFWNFNGSNWSESLRITSAGHLGIGTTTPGALLSLGSSTSYQKLALFESGNYQWGFGINSQEFESYFASDNISNHFSWGNMSYDGNHTFTEFMRLNGSGNLLIAKTTQTNTAYKLDINGSARVNTIVVNTSGADFVFKPSYKLSSLPVLQKYINHNHHLPGIASAGEMQANGLNLGENQTKLLQKTEELTLYLIQKDKQITELQSTVSKQQEQIDAQARQIQKLEAMVLKITGK